jgi:large subunit ribosomal protein L24
MGLRIKRNDTVLIMGGREKGKKGRVISVYPSEDKLLVERVNIIKKHMKPSKKHTQGGIIEKEATLHISNVMLLCPKCGKPTKIANTMLSDGQRVRTCKRCKEVI